MTRRMLSRVADSIYWVNRYMERIENYARFISVNIHLSLEAPGLFSEDWRALLAATADESLYHTFYDSPERESVIHFLTFDPRNPNAIFSCLSAARENARTIREALPKELWEHLNGFYLQIKEASQRGSLWESPEHFFEQVKKGVQLFWGMVDSTLSRQEGYYFGHLGRYLERGDKTSRFLDIKYFTAHRGSMTSAQPQDLLIWSSVLKSVSAYNMYRQQYKSVDPEHLVAFLVTDKSFPRSILYCVREAERALYAISGQRMEDGYSNEAERALGKLRHEIEYITLDEIFTEGLHPFLDRFQRLNNQIDQEVFGHYFAWKPVE